MHAHWFSETLNPSKTPAFLPCSADCRNHATVIFFLNVSIYSLFFLLTKSLKLCLLMFHLLILNSSFKIKARRALCIISYCLLSLKGRPHQWCVFNQTFYYNYSPTKLHLHDNYNHQLIWSVELQFCYLSYKTLFTYGYQNRKQ